MSARNFDPALDAVLRFEGGYADHPHDPGGATNRGITRATLALWRGHPVSKAQVRALTRTEAAAIYHAQYWTRVRGDDLPAGLDLALFDFAVNSGVSRAIRKFQRVLGVSEDGRIGPQVLNAMASRPTAALIRDLCNARRSFLKALSTYPIFGRGWMARVAAIEKLSLSMAAIPAPKTTQPTKIIHAFQQETAMDTTKSILASRTLWANTIGLLSLGLAAFGFNTSALDTGVLTDQLFQAVAAGSFVVSSLFRVFASKRLV